MVQLLNVIQSLVSIIFCKFSNAMVFYAICIVPCSLVPRPSIIFMPGNEAKFLGISIYIIPFPGCDYCFSIPRFK